MRNLIPIVILAVFSGSAATAARAVEGGIEPPMDLLATQLRLQGYSCDHPESAELDKQASMPNGKVWIVVCKGVRYRMTVVPDLASKIEKLGD